MRVNELIDILRDQPPTAEVELAVVAPVGDDAEDITVDRYMIDGVLPWAEPGADDADDIDVEPSDEEITIWLVGGQDDDVDAFLDAIEQRVDSDGEDG